MSENIVGLFTEPCNRRRCIENNLPGMEEWVGELNGILERKNSKDRIVGWFGMSDNYVLRTTGSDLRDVSAKFEICTGIKCKALSLSWLNLLVKEIFFDATRQIRPGVDLKLGAGFQIEGRRRYFDDFQIGPFHVQCFSRSFAKMHQLRHKNEQEPHGRTRKSNINWVRLSKELDGKLGGKWIARNISSVDGVLQRALEYIERNLIKNSSSFP